MDREPGRIGFMSTQRRESRWQRTSCMERARGWEQASPASIAGNAHAHANGGTAPPASPARLATNSLQSDLRIAMIARLVRQDIRHSSRSSSPPGTMRSATSGTPANLGSSLPLIPFPSGFASLHPTLPQAPAGRRRWAERYDGKRDLYLQHAA